jgi:alkylation response protein AidB-like acyl-CoA dehydrogenase
MRWLGVAQRAIEIATERALEREAFGKKLAEHEEQVLRVILSR